MENGLIPNTFTAWQLWHCDTFHADTPLSVQASGANILHGLYKLWHHTLEEGILENGNASFSRFHLTWGDTPATRVDIFVNPFGNPALLKLRRWTPSVFDDQDREDVRTARTAGEQKDAVLLRLAQMHYEFLQESSRWTAAAIDWSAEAREVLARVELISDPGEL